MVATVLYPNGSRTKPRVTDVFGTRRDDGTTHNGVDMAGFTYNRAVLAGTVTTVGWLNNDAGYVVAVDSPDPLNTARIVTSVMFHFAPGGIRVSKGQKVTEGQILGVQGTSGNSSGVHVHWEVRYWANGKMTREDPLKWIDSRLVIGGGAGGGVAIDQRIAGPSGAYVRRDPTSKSAEVDFLKPGTVGTFDGWKRGESVSGNNVWLRGSFSGGWVWSGGLTSKSTTGLKDLNAPTLGTTERKTVAAGAFGRTEPGGGSALVTTLGGGVVHKFSEWVTGQSVEGNDVWFFDGDAYFWSGGFEGGANKTGLKDGNPTPPPEPDNKRTVADLPVPLNGRTGPTTAFPVAQQLAAGSTGEFVGWAKGQKVTIGSVTSDIWYVGALAGNWFAAAGFTSQSTEGLVEDPDPPTEPTDPIDPEDNPRGLMEYTPFLPFADHGLRAPLGYKDDLYKQPAIRTENNVQPGVAVIDRYVLHYAWPPHVDDVDFFSWKNDRSSCPTWYLRPSGESFEFIRPGLKPAATGAAWNWRSVALEFEPINENGEMNDAQWEWTARSIAVLASLDGKMWDGVLVDFQIDRTHVIGHREALPGSTDCPGDWLMERMDELLDRAREIYDELYAPENPTEPTDPWVIPEGFALVKTYTVEDVFG